MDDQPSFQVQPAGSGSASQTPQDPSSASGSGRSPATNSASTPAGLSTSISGPTQSAASSTPQLSKRRRGLGVVTPNACTECRKKRAKCDGQKPCGRCKNQNDVECVYEVPVKQSKENLRTEIENLRRHQRSSDHVISALSHGNIWEEVLRRLRGGQAVEKISDWLENALSPSGETKSSVNLGPIAGFQIPRAPYGSLPSGMLQQHSMRQDTNHSSSLGYSNQSRNDAGMMSWMRTPPQTRVGAWVDAHAQEQDFQARYRGVDQVLYYSINSPMKVPANTWTNVTTDPRLVEHLLALYFCWEYPTFASLSKEHFLQDFREGSSRFCSPILVNALLALGCRFSNAPNTRADPNDPYSSGDHFFREALRLFNEEINHHSLTTIQALGIMSIREASCGRDSESWFYAGQSIRLAIEMGLHLSTEEGDEDEMAVKSATFWGAFALDHAWSLATGSLPQCSCFPILSPKPAIIDDIEASLWIPYTDDGAPLQKSCEQPSNVRSVYKCFCELSELVHQSLYVLHSPGRPLSSRDLLNIYTQYLNWYDSIPEVLRLGHNFTPAVLFAHMYYHFAILLLFRPLIKLKIVGSSILPRDVCTQAADAIQGLLRSYKQLYTLRRTPSFVPYFVLTSAIMHLAIATMNRPTQQMDEAMGGMDHSPPASSQSPDTSQYERIPIKVEPRVAEVINQGIADLTEMAPCHHFAEQALNILRYLASKWNIEVGITAGENYERSVRPDTRSLNFFAPLVTEADFSCPWGGSTTTAGGPAAQAAASLDNPLFWTFPLQGRPMLPSGRLLEEAGFELI